MQANLKQLSLANIYTNIDEYFQQDKPKLIIIVRFIKPINAPTEIDKTVKAFVLFCKRFTLINLLY